MSTDTGSWSRNGAKRVRFGSSNNPKQQNGGHKGLLERLNSVDQEQTVAPAPCDPEKPRYVDVTAAFFGKQRRPAQEINSQVLPPQPLPPRPVQQQKAQSQRHQEVGDESKKHRSFANESSVAKELREELAGNVLAESSDLYNHGLARIRDLYQALSNIMADASTVHDQFIALVESNQRKIIKSPSETFVGKTYSDDVGNETRREVCIGDEVSGVNDLVLNLETEVNQLWDAWEAADHHVQTKISEVSGGTYLSARKSDCVKGVWKSMADDMEVLGAEAEGIIEDSHEEIRACEKEFGKKIYGVMSAFLQQYLLED
ncbi:hypothetical protein KVR01_001212 [Diaporthe batatas]|uniref:uncharacterized protein n=1 Tax=Diaporthe batatas TaxID=748121 RepID=UPI001D037737|nr:uncharacterized protein KVR01_001212 [Diaporthe batatas]KAG8168463.1 hypothetical protein KVR01_001212 [Diaporthe batatas]